MIRFGFMLALMAAGFATAVLLTRRPVRWLAVSQIILTAAAMVGFAVNMGLAFWIHSLPYEDPRRWDWRPIMISSVLWWGTILPWLVFTVYHVTFAAMRVNVFRSSKLDVGR